MKRETAQKITRSFNINEIGTFSLIETNRTIVIEDIIISKEDEGKLTFIMSDGTNVNPFLFVTEAETEHFSFNNGLMFWTGANLEVENENGNTLITIGYYIVDGTNYEKWRLYKE